MRISSFGVRIRAEFHDYEPIGPKEAAVLLCQDINNVMKP
jgi:hypothetical protein